MNCDGCTLCCKLISVPWMKSPAGRYCRKCAIGVGCKIFESVDPRCKEYACLYNQMEKCSPNLRPDKCHVIFEKVGDNIITGLMEKGHIMNDDVKNQIGRFVAEGFSVYMSSFGNPVPVIAPAKGMTSLQVFAQVNKGIKKLVPN